MGSSFCCPRTNLPSNRRRRNKNFESIYKTEKGSFDFELQVGEDKDQRRHENKKRFSASSMLLFAYNCVMDGGMTEIRPIQRLFNLFFIKYYGCSTNQNLKPAHDSSTVKVRLEKDLVQKRVGVYKKRTSRSRTRLVYKIINIVIGCIF